MMVFTTLFLAVLTLAILWFAVFKVAPWKPVRYVIVLIVAGLFIWTGSVHFVYTGIEVAVFGLLLVAWDPKPKAVAPGA